jgi:D-sedoheptulose 7-phosphate isomerase
MFSVRAYLDQYEQVLRRLDHGAMERLAGIVFDAWRSRHTVFLCGNGGSAANASHIAADLTKLTTPARGPRLRAVAITESLPAISAIANDLAYEEVFAEQLRAFCEAGDVVIGLSTSGSSPNVLRAIEYANSVGAVTAGITGRGGSRLQELAQHTVVVDSTSVQHIEDATMVAGHILCLAVAEAIRTMHTRTFLRSIAADRLVRQALAPTAAAN